MHMIFAKKICSFTPGLLHRLNVAYIETGLELHLLLRIFPCSLV